MRGPVDPVFLARAARFVLRGGVIALLTMWGAFKFTAFEAQAIRPLVEHSPFLSWLYPVLGIRGTSGLIGVVELTAAESRGRHVPGDAVVPRHHAGRARTRQSVRWLLDEGPHPPRRIAVHRG